jgi:hypothetical protein
MLTCKHPDRDNTKLRCGYPLPCPHHTITVDLGADPPTVTIPLTSDAMRPGARRRVANVVGALVQVGDGNSMVIKKSKKRERRR